MNRLPIEILHNIFQESTPKQLFTYVLVCKAWVIPAQLVLYTHVTIESEWRLRKFHATAQHNPQLAKKVKTLHLKFSVTPRNALFIDLISNCLSHLEEITESYPETYENTLHALLNSKLKNLKRIQAPSMKTGTYEINNYARCIYLMKDRLEKICITDVLLRVQGGTFNESRLYNELNLFEKLKVVDIQVSASDEIQILEHVVEQCKALKHIMFSFQRGLTGNRGSLSSDNDITAASLSKYSPITTIKSVKCSLLVSDPQKLLLYIIHKYPRLNKLNIKFATLRLLQLDAPVVTRFFNYISRIPTFSVSDLTLQQNILADGTLKLGLKNMKIGYTEVSFFGARYILDINDKRYRYTAGDSLNYFGYGCNFDWQRYMNSMVKGGEFIHYLRFDFSRNSQGSPDKYVLPGNFMPHIFIHCTNLQHLRLERCVLKQISCKEFDPEKKISLKKLIFGDCLLHDGVLEEMSGLTRQIDHLDLSSVKYCKENIDEMDDSILDINMPYTNINTISIKGDDLGAFIHVKILTSTNVNDCNYYQFIRSGKKYTKFVSNEKNYGSCKDQRINVQCQTNPSIEFIYLQKDAK